MPQCELCGDDVPSLTTARVEGAELEVCESCAALGTEIETETSTTSTKYSTSSSSGTSGSAGSSSSSAGSSGGGGGGRQRRDMFDEMDELAPDYGERIRDARESRDLGQKELAKEISEKASLIKKLERGDILPSDDLQQKLERYLDISLTGEAGADEDEWESETGGDGLTLGDMVKRKD